MKMTNLDIYNYGKAMIDTFQDSNQKLPVKVNFYIQKNKATLLPLAQEIEEARINIIRTHGTLDNATGQYNVIGEEETKAAIAELDELFAIEQDVNIYKVNIDSFSDDISLTTGQMEAIMFMID